MDKNEMATLYTIEYIAGDYQVVAHQLHSPVFSDKREAEEYREYKRSKNGTMKGGIEHEK